MTDSRTKSIRRMNDRFRKGDTMIPGTIAITIGVQDLLAKEGESYKALISKVREIDDFNSDNDLHLEHSFGKLNFCRIDLSWKIDLYNKTYDGESEDSTDLSKTCRVLIIMLANEY